MTYKEFYFDDKQIGKNLIRLLRVSTINYDAEFGEQSSSVHSHDFYELLFVREGRGKLFVNGNMTDVASGDVIIIAPLQQHNEITTPDFPLSLFSVAFICTTVKIPGFIMKLDKKDCDSITIKINELLSNHGYPLEFGHLYCQNVAENIIIDLLRRLNRKSDNTVEPTHSTQIAYSVAQIREYIDQNFTEDLSVSHLATLACSSPEHFIRSFKRLTGVSPKNYVISKRINAAVHSLTYTDKSVKNICYEIGYSDINNFIRKFKAFSGLTPIEYRKLHRV